MSHYTNFSGFSTVLKCQPRSRVVQPPKPPLLSERYSALADECRTKAQSFRSAKPRNHMLDLAAEYERKAARAKRAEAWLARISYDDATLIPTISEIS